MTSCKHDYLSKVKVPSVPEIWRCDVCGEELVEKSKLDALMASHRGVESLVIAREKERDELESRLEEALERDRKGDTIIHELTLERDRLAGRLDSVRLLAHSWIDTPFTTMDKSTMRTLADELLRKVGEKWIAESNPGSGVERQMLCQHGQYPDSCPVCRV